MLTFALPIILYCHMLDAWHPTPRPVAYIQPTPPPVTVVYVLPPPVLHMGMMPRQRIKERPGRVYSPPIPRKRPQPSEDEARRQEAASVWRYGLRYGEGPLKRDDLPPEREHRNRQDHANMVEKPRLRPPYPGPNSPQNQK